jgi:predicted HAD superfamily hydrolase
MDAQPIFGSVEDSEAVAFDVFDTLVVRPFMRPRDLFGYLEDEYSAEGFAKARVDAEHRARETDRETDIDGIYACIDERYRFLKEIEIESEISLSFPDPQAKGFYERMKSLGKRIVLVTNTYLPEEVIGKILAHCGYEGWERIFVSCREKKSKRNGLYSEALEYLGLSPGKFTVVGDSKDDDQAVPNSLGMEAYRWIPMTERYLLAHPKEERFLSGYPGYAASAIVAMDMLFPGADDETYWHRVSRRFGGILCTAFARFVRDNTGDSQKLLFLSRDSYMAMKAWEELYGGKDHAYLYASRMTAKAFGSRDLSDRDTVISLMTYLREKGAPEGMEIPDYKHWKEFAEKYRGELTEIANTGHERIGRYIESVAGDASPVTVVDATTMNFTSQRDIQRYLAHSEINGCYYAVTGKGGPSHTVYNDRTSQHLTSSYVNLTEFFLGSGEPPLADISEDGKPVFRKEIPEDERRRHEAQPQIESGEMDCVNSWKKVFGERIPRIPPEASDGWLDVLMAEERGDDPDTLSGMKWAVNTQHTVTRHLIIRRSDIPKLALYKAAEKLHSSRKNR